MVGVIGNFDGVHLGHQYLLQAARREAEQRQQSLLAISFDNLPHNILYPESTIPQLLSFEDKVMRLQDWVDRIRIFHFDTQLATLRAEEFLRLLREEEQLTCLVLGYDNYFGSDRIKDFATYRSIGECLGIEMVRVQQSVYGDAEQKTPISSSLIRQALLTGQVERARELLDYPYALRGIIVPGQQLGRSIGYPTANISPIHPLQLIPRDGVYAVFIHIAQHQYRGMLYIGNRPTLGEKLPHTIEVNIFDFDADLYDQQVEVLFISYIRGNQKFSSVDDLKAQLARDKEEVLQTLNTYSIQL